MKFFSDAFSSGYAAEAPSSGNKDEWISYASMHGWGNTMSKTGIRVSEESALQTSAVFACQRAISESFAMLPTDIFKKLGKGKRQEESDHASAKVLTRQANPLQSAFNCKRTLQHHALSSGNGYAELQYKTKGESAGDVIAMWPLPPGRVNPIVFENKKGEIDLEYEITFDDGTKKRIEKERILHIPGLGFDGIRGYPLIQYMMNAVGLNQSLEEYSSLFFKQGAGLQGYVSIPENYDLDKIKNLRTHMGVLNEGLDNAHRFKFLYDSAKFTASGVSPSDAEMNISKVFQIQEIARFHRIPLHKIQETSKGGGYASLEQFNIEFVNDTLMPWITNWEQEINRKFFQDDDKLYVKFNPNVLLRGDAKSRALFYRTMVFTSIMTPNEARALEDLPPILGGDKRMIPLNMSEDGDVSGESDKSMDGNERNQD